MKSLRSPQVSMREQLRYLRILPTSTNTWQRSGHRKKRLSRRPSSSKRTILVQRANKTLMRGQRTIILTGARPKQGLSRTHSTWARCRRKNYWRNKKNYKSRWIAYGNGSRRSMLILKRLEQLTEPSMDFSLTSPVSIMRRVTSVKRMLNWKL